MNLRRRNTTPQRRPVPKRPTPAGSGTALRAVSTSNISCWPTVTVSPSRLNKTLFALKAIPEGPETGGPVNGTGRIVLAGLTVTLVMVGAPVKNKANPLKAPAPPEGTPAEYVAAKVAVQMICVPETSSEPSNARLPAVPAGNSTPEVTGTGPIGPLQRPGMLQKVVSSG